MQLETARELMQAIRDVAQIAISTQNRITALENTLSEESPALCQAYLEKLKRQRSTVPISPLALEELALKLTQS